jgi:hypothetical protein
MSAPIIDPAQEHGTVELIDMPAITRRFGLARKQVWCLALHGRIPWPQYRDSANRPLWRAETIDPTKIRGMR